MCKVRYKYCIVPGCRSSTSSDPDKLFFSVPVGEQRVLWCAAMGRTPRYTPLSPKCNRFCCQDHFDLEKDMENYMQWKLMGTKKLFIRKGVFPHKFDCQSELNVADMNNEQNVEPKKKRRGKRKEEIIDLAENLMYLEQINKRNKTKRKEKEPPSDNEKVILTLKEEEENILRQLKKLQKISQTTTDISALEMEALETYTFHIKVEAEENNEPDEAVEQINVPNTSGVLPLRDCNQFGNIEFTDKSSSAVKIEPKLEEETDSLCVIVYDKERNVEFKVEQ